MYTPYFANEVALRTAKIQHQVEIANADALLISSNVNLLYSTGKMYNGYAYIPAQGSPLYFVRRPLGLKGDNVIYIRKPEDIPSLLIEQGVALPRQLMLEQDNLPYSDYQRLAAIFPDATVQNGSLALRMARYTKTDYEIALLRESGEKHVTCITQVPALFEKGMSDIDFSIEIERLFRQMGSLGHFRISGSSMEIFMGSVIAGNNADVPSPYDFAMGGAGVDSSLPVGGDGTILQQGMSVMVDIGGNFTGYITDLTRTFTIGDISTLAQRAHTTSIAICHAVAAKSRPGVKACDLYNLAFEMVQQAQLVPYFMGHSQQVGFVGHGVGLELNEIPVLAPRSRDVLQEGCVFALEPKFVIPNVGAVGIENTYLVTSEGGECLTPAIEKLISLI